MLHELVTLGGHLAWPISILVILFFVRAEIRGAVTALTKRLADPSSDISIGKGGIEIRTRLEAALGRIESLEIDQHQARDLVLGVLHTEHTPDERLEGQPIDPDLVTLAENYLTISAADWAERVRLKDEVARKMATMVIARRISKDILAAQAHEGLIMALVSAIHTAPETGDFARISLLPHKVTRLHIKYRITMALGRIFEQHLATRADVDRASEALELFNIGADPPLRHRIAQTKAIINLALEGFAQST